MHNVNKLFISILMFILSVPLQAASLTITPILPDSSSLQWHDANGLPKGAKVVILAGNYCHITYLKLFLIFSSLAGFEFSSKALLLKQ